MTTSTTSQPRRFRLQVSLRMLLLLMAAVGVAIAVYRWPWEETKSFGISTSSQAARTYLRRTTYRRDGLGKPVKHGREQLWSEGLLLHEANFHDGVLDGPRRAFDPQGRVVMEAHYRGGELHGPFRAGDGQRLIWEGSYFKDVIDGSWKSIVHRQTPLGGPPHFDDYFLLDGLPVSSWPEFEIPPDPIVEHHHWNRRGRQGEWSWRTLRGELLSKATYDQDQLVTWNGQPVVEQFWQWLRSPAVNNPELVALLESAEEGNWHYERTHIAHCHRYVITNEGKPDTEFFLLLPTTLEVRRRFSPTLPHQDRSLATSLCSLALFDGCKFDHRYGTLWLVPAADPEPPFVDPTGVAKIVFEPGSVQERAWNEVVDMSQWKANEHTIDHLLEGTTLTKWKYFGTHDIGKLHFTPHVEQMLLSKRRRDILGLALYTKELRCTRIGISLKFGRQLRGWQQKPVKDFGDLMRDDF